MNVKKFLESLTPEEIKEGNRKQAETNERIYKEFKEAYEMGKCSLCGDNFDTFDKTKECFHWFLKPNGLRKKQFKKYLTKPIGLFRLDSYFRWMANLDSPMKNINDLKEEGTSSKLMDYTAKFKNIEWSISLGKTDFQGHPNSKNGDFPHFHLQMRVNDKVFIKFNDFHIPLSKADLFNLEAIESLPNKVVYRSSRGMGMSAIEDEYQLKIIDKMSLRTNKEEEASLNVDSFFQMPEGETMSGYDLADILEKSKKSKTPIRHLIKEKYPEASMRSFFSPGPGVTEKKSRTKRK